ncbi:hypothetical protein [Arthrobacter sp. MA-N2]|uniref:hypothetical protein n=1 Tax=Arthrobacter sp. MA-N2 TaxID=1101188 RepID=UPI0012DD6B4E|nr:hypothetical protein [Arthrobacter sp. MA-N2]
MANSPLTIRVPLEAELLIRVKGSDALHLIGTVTYETDINVVLQDAFAFKRENYPGKL